MRKVDTYEYVTMLKGLIEEGHEVNMVIAGSSMAPFLCNERDCVYLKAPDGKLKVGDIVFFQRPGGQYILHRICRIKKDGYYIVGDAQTQIEGPVSREQIFAVATAAKRKGKMIGHGDFWWDFFEKVWPRVIPLRPAIRRLYGLIK